MEWQKVTTGVFTTVVGPDRANVGLVVGDHSALLIDAGDSPERGAAILESASELAKVPLAHVVITHHHSDHWAGLAGMPNLTSYGHENLQASTSCPTPTEQFSLAKAIDLGGVRVELLHLGPAHSASDVLVLVPTRNTIFTGDLLEQGADPQFDETSRIGNWPMVLDGALGASNHETRFVPGHGQVVDQEFAFGQRAELAMIYETARSLIERGIDQEAAAQAEEWPYTPETMAQALPLLYRELAEKGVTLKRQLPLI